jgi:CheY-like chemotaxis protein
MPKTLLLADDSVTIQRVIELTFANEDVRVVSVGDGRRAVEWFDAEIPDVVLADVNVPEVDGYALAEFVKQSPRLRHVPVLLLAGAFEPVDQERVRATGCDGVLVKPFEPQQLVSRVRQMLDRVAEPAMVAVAAETHVQTERTGFHNAANPSLTIPPAPGGTIFEQAGFGDPEPLEAPSRPVWELGLPDPIHQAARPIEAARPSSQAASAAPVPKVSLVSAFSALLAAEQAAPATAASAQAAAAPVTEATVEDAVRRVLVRMTDDLVRRIVLETAERLIKEEIEKIKANPE